MFLLLARLLTTTALLFVGTTRADCTMPNCPTIVGSILICQKCVDDSRCASGTSMQCPTPEPPLECTSTCQAEFMTKCWIDECGKGQNAEGAFTTCVNYINESYGSLAAKCVAGCTPTKMMKVLPTLKLICSNQSTSSTPSCTVTDGSKANDAACMCGAEECTTLTGLWCFGVKNGDVKCHSTPSTSSTPSCTVTDGSKANDAACMCGAEECTTLTGLWCFGVKNGDVKCHSTPPTPSCTVTDGSKANDAVCMCGAEECTTLKGLICSGLKQGGLCQKKQEDCYPLSVVSHIYIF